MCNVSDTWYPFTAFTTPADGAAASRPGLCGSMGCFLLNVSLQNEHPLMESAFMSGRQTPEHSELPPLSELAGVQIGYKAQRAGTILTLRDTSQSW